MFYILIGSAEVPITVRNIGAIQPVAFIISANLLKSKFFKSNIILYPSPGKESLAKRGKT